MKTVKKYITFIALTIYLMLIAFTVTHAQENNYLKAVYNGKTNNVYTVTITNKQNCKVDFQLDYTGTANSIVPNPKNEIHNNQLEANQTKSFLVTGNLTAIRIKALSICNWSGESTWLPINFVVYNTLPLMFGELTVVPYHAN